ncbi:equilibrative nucleoside transporter 1-like isoform X3 [Palaemon carinicauda]|uniref:equilibrative nucleoside transporter 1-like isoform X3 n=1 Tax=Palaemon carinicauda TaxID=392227 RepID=UPI0035B6463B
MENQTKAPFLVLVIFYAIGIASLLPWNFFITPDGYWQYKLRNVSLGDDWNAGKTNYTALQVTFTPTLVIVSNVFCTVFLIIASAIVNRVSEWTRHVGSLLVSLVAMIAVTVMTFINTDSWQVGFYTVTMIIVAFLNMAVAIVQASSYGLAGMFPESCMNGVVSGQAMSGVFSSLAMIISLLVGGSDVISAFIFFLVADVTLVLTIAGYIYLTKTNYYAEVKSAISKSEVDKTQSRPIGNDWVSYSTVLKKPGPEGMCLHIAGAARVVFIPLLMLCHGDNKTFPTLFDNDGYYVALLFLFAFTNGYIMSLTLIYYPSLVLEEETELAGTIMGAFIGVEMVIGSLLSPAFVALWGPSVA